MEQQLNEVQQAFGSKVCKARLAKKLSKKQLANSCGCDEGTISRLKRNIQQPQVILAKRISVALNVSLY